MRILRRNSGLLALLAVATCSLQAVGAILVQPQNYMLDDSSMMGADHQDSGSLSPFYNDNQAGSNEHSADKDIVGIIGDGLARLRYARMMEQQQSSEEQQSVANQNGQLSQEMAELLHSEQAQASDSNQDGSLSSSVAGLLLNVAQAAAQATANSPDASAADAEVAGANSNGAQNQQEGQQLTMSARGNIMELDTSSNSGPQPSKTDLKNGPHSSQWFNPKETIPVLKISSMATPSKYKKVYFRSEKKLVDGAFHSLPSNEQKDKKGSLIKAFNSGKGVQRRSSRGTSSSAAPPGILQDGVIDFLKKFRDVYIQTRPVQQSSSSLASSVVSAAASSPLAAFVAPSSGSGASRPNLASAISAATSMMSSAAQTASASSGSSATSSTAAASSAGSPFSAQSYVSFWSKTFPTWVRKMLKQMRRRSLYNSSKRQQQQHGQHHTTSLGQAAQAAASSVIEHATNSASSSGSSSSSSSS